MDSDDLYAFDNTVVHKTGDETVSGTKTFSSSPIAPTPTSGDSSTKVATTEFVTDAIGDLSSNAVKTYGDQTIAGTKTFSTSPLVPTPSVGDNTTKAATTAYINNKFQVVNSLPASPNSDTFYFIRA